jgi:hypothetical protein
MINGIELRTTMFLPADTAKSQSSIAGRDV